MYVILITDLPRVWGGDQGTMHSAGHFVWLRRRRRQRWTLPRTAYLGINLTSLGEAISSTTHRNLLPVNQGGTLSVGTGPHLPSSFTWDWGVLSSSISPFWSRRQNTSPSTATPSVGAISSSQNYSMFSVYQDNYHLFNPHKSAMKFPLQWDPFYGWGNRLTEFK